MTLIFHREGGTSEGWLTVEPDRSLTYRTEATGHSFIRNGPQERAQRLSAAEARKRWPQHARAIDNALAALPHPPRAVVAADGATILLRIYRGSDLSIEVPLDHRRAIAIATDLLLEARSLPDALELEPAPEGGVADEPGHAR